MGDYYIREVSKELDFLEFTMLPFRLYKNNKYWVPPIIKEYVEYIKGKNNDILKAGAHALFLVWSKNEVVGRIIVFIDDELNEIHKESNGYIAEFECVEDYDVAKMLLDRAMLFCVEHGKKHLKGPVSLPNGEDHRGFIVDNFEETPSIMNIYNHKYYNDFWVSYGFEKYHDCYAYSATKNDLMIKAKKVQEILPKIVKRFDFYVEELNIKERLDEDIKDIYTILNESLPKEWKDFKPVTLDQIYEIFQLVEPFINPSLVCIARTNQGKPIGFNLALPDYNEILKKWKGKQNLIKSLKFMFQRKNIKRVRMFVMFVHPDYRKKGVSAAIYFKCFKNAIDRGFTDLEGSTIWDYNTPMISDIEKFGARRNITYRIYKKKVEEHKDEIYFGS